MNKYLFLILLALLSACDNKDDNLPEPPGADDIQRTVLAYLVGDNLAGDLSPYMRSDFDEMLVGMESVDITKNNLLIYSDMKTDVPHLIHIKKVKGIVVADTIHTYQEQNPLNKAVMTDILEEVIDKFSAKSYGLVLASHGGGWLPAPNSANSTRWFGEYRRSYMDIADLRDVLEDFPKFNFLFFDACYMQTIEVAYELRNCADYIISSPAEIPGPGAPYQKIVPLMFADKDDVGIDIARGYYDYYKDGKGEYYSYVYNRLMNWIEGVSVSTIKTGELEVLAMLTKSLLVNSISNREEIDVSSLLYYDSPGTRYYYDFDGFIRLLVGDEDSYNAWRMALDNAQPYFETTSTNYSQDKGYISFDMSKSEGISIYVPRNNLSSLTTFYHALDWYNAGGWESVGW